MYMYMYRRVCVREREGEKGEREREGEKGERERGREGGERERGREGGEREECNTAMNIFLINSQ